MYIKRTNIINILVTHIPVGSVINSIMNMIETDMTIKHIDIINVLTTHTTMSSDIIDMIASKAYREPRSFEVGGKYRVINRQSTRLKIKIERITKCFVEFFVYRKRGGRHYIVGDKTRVKKRIDNYGGEWLKSDHWLIETLRA